jgi:hypothetical protein
MAFVVANHHPAPEAVGNAQAIQEAARALQEMIAISQSQSQGDNAMLPAGF